MATFGSAVCGLTVFMVIFVVLDVHGFSSSYSHHQNHHRNRHHQPSSQHKYPHLERLLNKLDSAGAGTNSTGAVSKPDTPHRKDSTLRSSLAYQQLDDSSYDDDDSSEESSSSQSSDSNESKVAWDLKLSDGNYPVAQPTGYSLSSRKWEILGNRKNLEEYRKNYMQRRPSEAEVREAIQHTLKLYKEGSCKVPQPKVIQVKDVYPHPSKTYIPHCTILHQCGDDTGCCRHDTLTCVPKKSHRVELYFYTATVGSFARNSVEKLAFFNHTECECQDKTEEMMPRDTDKLDTGRTTYGSAKSHIGPYTTNVYRPFRPERLPEQKSCRCPGFYSVRHLADTSCDCDCFDKDRACIRLKRGKDYFSLQDRLCIQSERCQIPTCEFGSYIRRNGRCTRKREKFAAWQRYVMDDDAL